MQHPVLPVTLIDGVLWHKGTPLVSTPVKKGYHVCHINAATGWPYRHRIVMECVLGRTLTTLEEIDHINQIKGDDRPINLRVVTRSENHYNKKQKNVYYDRSVRLWRVKFKLPNKRTWNVCTCTSEEEASIYAHAIHRDVYPILSGLRAS
jgi:hypothetical protein